MKFSHLFTKTLKDAPSDESAINAQLLIRGGFIDKHMAGIYNYLPLGLKVFRKIENIIREEMNLIGGQEMLMSALQPKELWERTGRWLGMQDIMYQFEDGHGGEVGLATTHEEVVTELAKQQIKSYKDLPVYIYQIQNKFRNEKRAKSGLLRGREFSMKDLYSFHIDEADLKKYYDKVLQTYIRIFNRLGLDAFIVEASGGAMSKDFSHEFMIRTIAGEDVTVYCGHCAWAQNKEIAKVKAGDKCPNCGAKVIENKTVEAGNIFRLGTKYSTALGLQYATENGELKDVLMGSYGIGLGRLMGTIVEVFSDDKGIIWPESVAPFKLHLIEISSEKSEVREMAEKIYKKLGENNVLYDDRDLRAGEKFADSDLLGMPYQIVVSEKNFESGKLELKNRKTGEIKMVTEIEIYNLFN